MRDKFSARILGLMRAAGETTSSLARRSGIPQRTVHNLLYTEQKIDLSAAEALAQAFGLHAWQILAAEDIDGGMDTSEVSRLIRAIAACDKRAREMLLTLAQTEADRAAHQH